MVRQRLDQQKAVEEAKREAEEKRKKVEEEKAAKEEEAKAAMARKLEKEEEEKRRQWEIKKLLVQQREEYEVKLAKLVDLNRNMKEITIGARKKKSSETSSSTSEEDEEEAEEVTPLKDKRKRHDSTSVVESSPPVETPKKLGKLEEAGTPANQKRRGRGRPTKVDAQAARLAKGEDPWEGVPMGDKYATESVYRKAVRKAIASFYPETLNLKAICKGVGLSFHGINDAVDTLSELRVTYCYRGKKSSGSTSSKPGEEEQIRGEIQEPQEEQDE
ncbi:hypothetical protein CBR_g8259 [Chara braunii]|uniref:Uncharacterized protein n=1 Tax=Chara braunii TaxID=69332 RepID=A0A388KLN0_CHABU|nr:hypothetical protein CBR_g8259 [Chara braunii]|eukprot:GBG70959.1 hypothetical protein CBR_g8259 [Chara braunii]